MANPVNIKTTPLTADSEMYAFLESLRTAVLATAQQSIVPPRPVANFTVTPGPGTNLIRFTRSDGNTYALYVNSVPQLDKATRIDLGLANNYTDNIGKASVIRYYWMKTRLGQLESIAVGPVSGTTLALTSPTTITQPPADSETPALSDETGAIVPTRPTATTAFEDL